MDPLPEVQCEAHAEWEQGWEKQDLPVRLISHVFTQLENTQNSNFVYLYHQKKKKRLLQNGHFVVSYLNIVSAEVFLGSSFAVYLMYIS